MNASLGADYPNLFIIGAPKCGTTSLYDYLVQYPDIRGGLHKEPHFFNDDQDWFRHAKTLEEYLGFFQADRKRTSKFVVDASTHYIYSKTAVANIRAFDPKAKFIVMLRNPVDLVRSLHEHLLFRQSESEPELSVAWDLGPISERAPDFVKQHPYPAHTSYQSAGRLGAYLKKVMAQVPVHQLLVIFFEDLVKDANVVLSQTMDFLQIERINSIELEKRNRAKSSASRWLNRLLLYPPPAVRRLKQQVKQLVPKILIRKLDLYSRIGRKRHEKRTISVELRRQIVDHFRSDIQLLSEITGRDLGHWMRD